MRRAAIASSLLSLVSAGLLAGSAGLLAGCPDRSISKVDPLQGRVEFKDIPITVNRDVDILFLIDDSPSMADKQANLAANFPQFIKVLETIQGGLPNVHIAVVTSDMGTKGANGTTGGSIGTLGQGGCASTGKNGNMQLYSASTDVMGGQFINDTANPDGSRTKNYSGDLSAVFAKMATGAGAGGCGFEQHLEAVKQALTAGTHPANDGFLRADAYLAVIIIADEDDCSLQDPGLLTSNESGALGALQSFRCTQFGILCDDGGVTDAAMKVVGTKGRCHPNDQSKYLTKVNDYVTFLKGLKPADPTKVIVAGIMGTTDPFAVEMRPPPGGTTALPALAHSCTYTGRDGKPEVADPPIRMKTFLDQFPNRSTFASICQQDLSGGLQQIGDLLKSVIGDPCIEGKLADTDPVMDGKQVECSVSTVTDPGTPTAMEKLLKQCGTGVEPPCWELVSDPVACPCSSADCPNTEHFKLKIQGQEMLGTNTHVLANCVTEVTDSAP